MPATGSCGICTGEPDRLKGINRLILTGASYARIEREMASVGYTVKRETVTKHHRKCLGMSGARNADEVRLAAAAQIGDSNDFAALVKAEAVRKLQAGELRVTTMDGLTAQTILDKRVEKQKDRELMVQIGRLLAGGDVLPPRQVVGEVVIEADYEEVTPKLLV